MSELDELRALVREVIGDLLPHGLPGTETVSLSTDEDLAAFVHRLLGLDPDQREEVRSGRKRFRLAAPDPPPPAGEARSARGAPAAPAQGAGAVRRIERGAVTERVIDQAARAGERLVLGRGAVLTPLARDRARAAGVEIEKER
jgi:hypothetical protein